MNFIHISLFIQCSQDRCLKGQKYIIFHIFFYILPPNSPPFTVCLKFSSMLLSLDQNALNASPSLLIHFLTCQLQPILFTEASKNQIIWALLSNARWESETANFRTPYRVGNKKSNFKVDLGNHKSELKNL